MLTTAPHAHALIPGEYQRHILDYPCKEVSGTIPVGTSKGYLYYTLPQGKAIRCAVTVGEGARLVGDRPGRPIPWAFRRGISTKATRTRCPDSRDRSAGYIGRAISRCIRMPNEDAIDLRRQLTHRRPSTLETAGGDDRLRPGH